MTGPVFSKPIPVQTINELASFGPFDLNDYLEPPDGSSVRFSAALKTGEALPKGMILTADGLLTGIPAKNTQGVYEVMVTAENDSGSTEVSFVMTIKPSLANTEADYMDRLKSQVWEALGNDLPPPELGALLELPISQLDVYYLLERWGTLTIWDAENLEPPGEKQALELKGMSQHYHVYDRGSSLIMVPKDLFSHERGVQDGVITARAMAREVYKRGWTIEMAGLDKWARTAWVEFQLLGDRHGKHLEILNYDPSPEEMNAYNARSAGPPEAPEPE